MPVCPNCQQPVAPNAPLGLCPACLIKSGFNTRGEPGGAAARGAEFVPPPPEEIARYFPQLEILRLIGKGGMGAVYKARQRHLDRVVALKVLPLYATGDLSFAERFEREAKALARLNHPNIVAIYDSGQQEGYCFFLMEFVDGVNLRQLERSHRPSPEEALAMVPPICEALQYAHQQGIIHRDIKPENILIDKNGRVKIADFGLAKVLDVDRTAPALTAAGQVMGTPHYMAPEQLERPAAVDHRADIYSLGVVLYELLTGELPLGKFAPPSEKAPLDSRLDQVVLRALEKEPEKRYQQVKEVETQVEAITSGAINAQARAGEPQALAGGQPLPEVLCAGCAQVWRATAPAKIALLLVALLLLAAAVIVAIQRRSRTGNLVHGQVTVREPLSPGNLGWCLAGRNVAQYAMSLDRKVRLGEKASMLLKSVVAEPEGFGTMMQTSRAEPFRGRRVRMSGYIRTEAVVKGAGLWLRADGANGEMLACSDMDKTQAKGTMDWTSHELTLDIPGQASQLAFGVQLVGAGRVWLDDLRFEVVREAVAPQLTARGVSTAEIRSTSVAEWFKRLGRDLELGYAPFTVLNALTTKAKESQETQNEIMRVATETIDDLQQNMLKRWQCCYILSGIGQPSGIAALTHALKDQSSVVRGVAACALGTFDHPTARAALQQALANESNTNVQDAIQKALRGEYKKPQN